MRKLAKTSSKHPPAELNLVGQNELGALDRWALERRCRALAHAVYLGDRTALCRILGRYKLYVDSMDVGFGAHVMLDGVWESWLTVFMAQQVRPGMRVVDAGANHGYYTLLFADQVGPDGQVAAIEPNPRIARLLKRSVNLNGFGERVRVLEYAAVDSDDLELVFHNPENEPKNARVIGAEYADHPEVIRVPGARLDTLLADWPSVDFMKIDVEGSEGPMLEGAWTIIQRDAPSLLLEFSPARGADPGGLLDRLMSVYSAIEVINHDNTLTLVTREQLMDPTRRDDWNVFIHR